MSDSFKRILIIGLCILCFGGSLAWWFGSNHFPEAIELRIPGMDNRPKLEPRSDSVIIGEFFDTLNLFDSLVPGEWPRFRGTSFDNIYNDSIQIAESWDSTGPPVVWKVRLGEGYAGPVVSGGRVYVMDYDERRKADLLRCFSLSSGIELWRRWYYVEIKRNHGYSRTIPAIYNEFIVTIGPRSHVMCLNKTSGEMYWNLDMEREYEIPGTEKGRITPDFYSGQCPLIDNGVTILAPGGKALMTAIDCATGEKLWETPNPDSIRMSHSSIMIMNLQGKRMYVYNGVGGICGVSAEPEDAGRLLWSNTDWSPGTTAASPVQLNSSDIAVFGSYGAGGGKIKVSFDGTSFKADLVESHKSTEGISSDQQTPILLGNHIWSVMPENAGGLKKQLVCYNINDLKTPVWTSGQKLRFGRGLGPYIVRGDKLFLLDDDANLFVFKITENSAELISQHTITDGIEAWAPIAMAGKFMLMRDSKNLFCLDIEQKN